MRLFAIAFGLLAVAVSGAGAKSGAPLAGFAWSDDGTMLVAVESENERIVAVRLVDGASGTLRGELLAKSLSAAFDGASPDADELRLLVGRMGRRVLLANGERTVVWTPETGDARSLEALPAVFDGPRFSPDGDRLGYVVDAELWSLDLDTLTASRLAVAVAVAVEAQFAWSPDGRKLAFAQSDADGGRSLAVVDLDDPRPRTLDTDPLGAVLGFDWRFDTGALGVIARSSDGGQSLGLCHPDRLYCRPLARRSGSTGPRIDDFRFLADGFLWGSNAGEAALAFYDTLGRQLRSVVSENERLLDIVALFGATREVLVAVAGESGAVRLLLAELHGGQPRQIGTAPGWPPVAISETLRAWVRPRKDADDHVVGYLLEGIDGTAIRSFSTSGAPTGP